MIMEEVSLFVERLQLFSFTNYCATGCFESATVCVLILGTIIFILNKITNDYSWADRLWSLLPIAFVGHFLSYTHYCLGEEISLKQKIMFGGITVWGLRLTYNFARKGGYTLSGEDYRWVYIRKRFPKIMVELLNFFFISYYLIFLIFLFCSPVYFAKGDITPIDIGLFAVWMLLLLGEVMADRQQWNFQESKKNKTLKDLQKAQGFLTSGLWRYSRHPNFFCEISMWWVIAFIGVNSSGLNWSIVGAVLLNLLFLGSTKLTENISGEKYPKYKEYQNSTSMLIPFLIFRGKKKDD